MNIKVIERAKPNRFSSDYDLIAEKLKSLGASQAIELEIPQARNIVAFRNSLASALKVRGISVIISLDNKNNTLTIWLK